MDWKNFHYKVTIGNDGRVLYADAWGKVMEWINNTLTKQQLEWWWEETSYEKLLTGNDVKYWNETHDSREQIVISYLHIPFSKFYERRQAYMNAVNRCDILLEKARRTNNPKRRANLLAIFNRHYELANAIWQYHPQVWMGEI